MSARCRCLRTKSMFIAEAEEVRWGEADSFHWCAQTQTACGPDEDLVAPDVCTSARSCYAPSPSASAQFQPIVKKVPS